VHQSCLSASVHTGSGRGAGGLSGGSECEESDNPTPVTAIPIVGFLALGGRGVGGGALLGGNLPFLPFAIVTDAGLSGLPLILSLYLPWS